MGEILPMAEGIIKFVQSVMFFGLIMFVISLGFILLTKSNESGGTTSERRYYLNKPLKKIKKHLELSENENENNRETVELLINRIDEISYSLNKLYVVDKTAIRKQSFAYLDVACYHEYESVKKLIEMIDRGIPITHDNVMELLEAIVEGLENKYENFIQLCTEELVQETKVLKKLQQKEIEEKIIKQQ
ncbi:hypothetical protein [Solibacillus sp. NPDC093137]|uniref:hypothetical protein n=1 Tax=Solibacillus sp. NPDC093137 TaxID=3390678 RepID=UPI003D02B8C8